MKQIFLLPLSLFTKNYLGRALLVALLGLSAIATEAQQGQALNFDGSNDFVQLPITFSGSYTKEVWVNANTIAGFPNILSGDGTTGTALFLNNGRLAAGHGPSFNQVLDPTPLTTGVWYHVAVTFESGTGILSLYKNGVLVTSNTAPAYIETFQNIGNFGGANNFNGDIDEVRIWSVAKTQAEIQASNNCALTGDEPFLLAYYDFNQGVASGNNSTETILRDRQDKCSPFDGTLQNFSLTGATSNWVAPGAPITGTCSSSFANVNISGNNNCVLNADATPSTSDFTNFGDFGAVPITRNFIIENTGNAPLNISGIIITGTDAANFTYTTPTSPIAPGDSAVLAISFTPTGANGVKNATVTINTDDVDEAIFTFAISGNFVGSGQTLSFDGINDYVSLPVNFSGSYTKEAWINTNTLTGFPNILAGDPSTGTALFLNNGALAAGHGPAFNQVVDPTPLLANTWYHVAVTYNAGTGQMNLYKNGALVATNTAPTYTETFQNIGNYNNANFFSGLIDEIRIWNVERTAAEIAANTNCPLSGGEAGLIVYYNFNQGAAGGDNPNITMLNDLHGDCPMNGQLQNFALTGTTSNWVAPGAPLSGTCTAQIPNVSVAGNAICIITGDATPSTADNTDFGTVNISSSADEIFYIRNNGGADLNVNSVTIGGPDATSFTVINFTAVTIVPGDSSAVTIRFAPTTSGVKNATVTINNNDANEGAYSFAVRGTAIGTVPVTLLYFRASAAGRSVRLTWETRTEINNAGFELLRSTDNNQTWQRIGSVAAGTNSSGSRYGFDDITPAKGINAYRLKQVDVNGRSVLSNVELVNFEGDLSNVTLFPNPVVSKVSIVINDSKLLNTQANISNASGAKVGTVIITNFQQDVNLAYLQKGIYFIHFNNGTILKIVKL